MRLGSFAMYSDGFTGSVSLEEAAEVYLGTKE